MSTVKLKKPHGGHKAGETISVSYAQGRDMVARGEAEYPGAEAPKAAPVGPTVSKSELESARRRITECETANDRLQAEKEELLAENKKLKSELESAQKRAAEAEKALAEAKKK